MFGPVLILVDGDTIVISSNQTAVVWDSMYVNLVPLKGQVQNQPLPLAKCQNWSNAKLIRRRCVRASVGHAVRGQLSCMVKPVR